MILFPLQSVQHSATTVALTELVFTVLKFLSCIFIPAKARRLLSSAGFFHPENTKHKISYKSQRLEISVALKRIFQDNINEPELQLEGHLPAFIIKNVVQKGSKKRFC